MTESFFNKGAGLRPEALAPVLSCEFYKISKNTFFYRTRLVAASEPNHFTGKKLVSYGEK